jgi:hypothetical protein
VKSWALAALLVSESGEAIHGNLECSTNFNHADVGQSSKAFYEDGDRDALNGVEIHRRTLRNRVVSWFEHNFAGQSPNGRRAWSDDGASKT